MKNNEELIKEKRTVEAIKKGLMGAGGKIGIILKYIGQPIMAYGGGLYDVRYLDEEFQEESEDLPTFDEEDTTHSIGMIFDGLSNGDHIELKYLENKKELTVTYKGILVYKEASGELEAYVPSEEWERVIEKYYVPANRIKTNTLKEERTIKSATIERKKEQWLNKMKEKWGV